MSINRKTLSLILALAITSATASPIQYLTYHPDRIPNITTAPGIASEIIFEEDETIEYATFGFDSAWQSQIVKDHILIFKAQDPEPETNLLVHTNKRHYVFTLTVGNNDWTKDPRQSSAIYSLRIKYQDNKSKARQDAEKAQALRLQDPTLNTQRYNNYDYRATDGATQLIPQRIWDNGVLTFIEFKSGAKRGSIYELNYKDNDKNRELSLINSHTDKNGLLIVHGVYPYMLIRLGDEAVELRRNHQEHYENHYKTGIDNTIRAVDNNAPTEFKNPTPPENAPLTTPPTPPTPAFDPMLFEDDF